MRALFVTLLGASLLAAGCNDKAKNPPQDAAPQAETNETAPEAAPESTASVEDITSEMTSGNFARAAELAREATAAQPSNPDLFLLLARAEARLGNQGYAIDALNQAFEKGFHDPRGAVNHPDFDKIRGTQAFQSLMKKWGIQASAVPSKAKPSASVTRAGDVSITESGGHTRIRAGDIVIEE